MMQHEHCKDEVDLKWAVCTRVLQRILFFVLILVVIFIHDVEVNPVKMSLVVIVVEAKMEKKP